MELQKDQRKGKFFFARPGVLAGLNFPEGGGDRTRILRAFSLYSHVPPYFLASSENIQYFLDKYFVLFYLDALIPGKCDSIKSVVYIAPWLSVEYSVFSCVSLSKHVGGRGGGVFHD